MLKLRLNTICFPDMRWASAVFSAIFVMSTSLQLAGGENSLFKHSSLPHKKETFLCPHIDSAEMLE